jgi:serine/threonine protein kinase
MGEVYRARDTRLARDVAIKVLPGELARDPQRRQRLEREAQAISALSHPNVCSSTSAAPSCRAGRSSSS